MAEFPSLPLWTDAYLADCGHLTTIEHGAYLLLLMTMWRAGGKLPNDDKQLARFARLTPKQWERIKPSLWGFFEVSPDSISQGRLTDEYAFVRQQRKLQSNRAKSRWLKNNKTDDAAAVPELCPHTHTHTHTSKEHMLHSPPSGSNGESSNFELLPDAPDQEPPEDPLFIRFWEGFPRRRRGSKSGAKAAWKRATERATPDEILSGLNSYAGSEEVARGFAKGAAAWLNDDRWASEYKPAAGKSDGSAGNPRGVYMV